nr:unnamed protein product [Spirometra erinaceieuropaei]
MDKTTIYAVLGKKSASTVFVISKEENCANRIISDRKPNKDTVVKSKENKQFMSRIRKALFALRNAKVGEDDEYESSCANTSEFELVFASDLSETTEEVEDEPNGEEKGGVENEENLKEGKQENEDEPESRNSSPSSNSSGSGSDNESDDTESEEPDYHCSRGYHTFVKACLQRKLVIREMIEQNVFKRDSNVAIPLIGPEHRVAAVCTFHTRDIEPNKRIVHIVFMTVRKHLRRLGIGSKVLDILKSTDISGQYDAVVVHADNNAVDFFKKNGFSDDLLINRQWTAIADEYVNCALMTYFPPISCKEKTLEIIDDEISDWLKKSADLEEIQLTLLRRLRGEIAQLRRDLREKDLIIERYKRQVAYQAEETNRYRLRLKYMGESKEGAWSPVKTGRLPLHLDALDLRVTSGCDEIYHQLAGNFAKSKALTPIGDL